MFSRQKIATVSGIIGSIAVICVGAAHAQADENPRGCKTNAAGETTCVHKSQTVHSDKRGTYVFKQTQSCSTESRPRLVLPEDGMLNNGSTNVGPVVDCSNTAPMPRGFKRPHIKKPYIAPLHVKKPHIKPIHIDF
ncbi:hypothetical protein GCM10022403_089900 [Streptomyces coacervatus]|uniref:Secreted protein n=1 Tax=Streptomyces coacervatus TaxID=647381 RepID=A0ABP7JH26_9ACTN|nr:hypothetical protein [Streptomyces coacervatus]MDF2271168.1 hypothetical protein [Streptomyces coacervatus]